MSGDKRLGMNTKQILKSDSELMINLINLFEIELKLRTNKLKLPGLVSEFLEQFDIQVYYPTARELSIMMGVDINHTDPFDCALLGLGRMRNWDILTSDDVLLKLKNQPIKIMDSKR